MKKYLYIYLAVLTFSACNDGDIITEELDFEDTFSACGELVFYKIKEDPAESLSLKITSEELTLADLITSTDGVLETTEEDFTINGTTNTFNYRRYNTNPTDFFCNDVPSSSITITNDEQSTTGTATVYISLEEDDDDGIDADLEDLNDNDDLTDDDTDGDGIPNYLDEDDDGDNVLTINEIDTDDLDGDDNPLTNPLDTDGDGTPDYLDEDDDNDGIDTIDEENESQDQNPANDFTDGVTANYLTTTQATLEPATAYRDHEIQQNFEVKLEVFNIVLPSIEYDYFDFGTLEDSSLSKTRTVEIPF